MRETRVSTARSRSRSFPPAFAQSEELRIRFEREAKAISSLNHPHICTLYDVGQTVLAQDVEEETTLHYLVMELIEGESLLERLKKGPSPPSRC